MKIRTDFVTNSSSSSFTIINFDSPLVEAWIRNHPVKMKPNLKMEFHSFKDMLEFLASDIDAREMYIELIEDKGIIGNIISALTGGDEEREPAENLAPLVHFLKENREAIESEGQGEFIFATQNEMEAPTIDAIRHQEGNTSHTYLSLDEIDFDQVEDESIFDFNTWTEDTIRNILDSFAADDE